MLSSDSVGVADPEIEEIAGGVKTNNIKLILSIAPIAEEEGDDEEPKKGQFVNLGVLFDEGRQVAMKGPTGVATLRKITEVELEEILNDCDPIEAPPGDYTIKPEKSGGSELRSTDWASSLIPTNLR